MTPAQLTALYRSEAFDTVAPYLWSDAEIRTYAIEAEAMFARLTGGIQDATSDLARLSVVTGGKWIELDSKILRIVSASLRSTGLPVTVLNPPDLQDSSKYWGPSSINLPGPVCAIVVGMDDTSVRVVQVPQATDTIDLIIERLPVDQLEIPEQHHYYLLYWMRHLAFLKPDSETFDKAKSAEEKANFEAYCREAFLEKERRKSKPRLIHYGGIAHTVISRRW